jgi:Tol biopolymer transport system component
MSTTSSRITSLRISTLTLAVLAITGSFLFAIADAATLQTRLISRNTNGVQGDAESYLPSISADGRFVAFESGSTNLVGNDTNDETDIFLRDREANRTTRISVNTRGDQGDGGSYNAAMTPDGRYVAFTSDAQNLVPHDTNGQTDVFVRDRMLQTTRRVSVNTAGFQGNLNSYDPSISDDGRFIAFWSPSTNLVLNDDNAVSDVFLRDMVKKTTKRLSVSSNGTPGDVGSFSPSITGDGRFVAFNSGATNLVPDDGNAVSDIFVRDRKQRTTRRVSVSTAGVEGNGASTVPSISDDGMVVAFRSVATNLVPNDTNATDDVFVRNRVGKVTKRVSVSTAGTQGDQASVDPEVTPNGRFVAFASLASTLVGNDENLDFDVFLRDRKEQTTRRVSLSSSGEEGDGSSIGPSLTPDARTIAFYSDATNLVGSDTNGHDDIFVRGP